MQRLKLSTSADCNRIDRAGAVDRNRSFHVLRGRLVADRFRQFFLLCFEFGCRDSDKIDLRDNVLALV